jgi:hypothetical protein
MLPSPALDPQVGFHQRIRVAGDYYTTTLGKDHSIDPIAIDRLVEVHADLMRFQAQLDGTPVADHRHSWGRNARVAWAVRRRACRWRRALRLVCAS